MVVWYMRSTAGLNKLQTAAVCEALMMRIGTVQSPNAQELGFTEDCTSNYNITLDCCFTGV